jgi:4-amino-4-deoxy-L-arabinose transferase-like glycosyltransferase
MHLDAGRGRRRGPRSFLRYAPEVESSVRWRPGLLPVAAILALALVVLARWLGPSDLWGQTQPRTIAYTADMLVRGGVSYVLAMDVDGFPATKPPLYNWLALPWVALFGREIETAHRIPSILAAVLAFALIVRIGERIGRGVGWLGALAWTATFPTFKLAFLARPDMVLCLVLFVGWWCATRLVLRDRADDEDGRTRRASPFALAVGYWLMVVFAAWTKGPTAVLLLAYPPAVALWFDRSLRPLAAFRPFLLGPPALLLAASWYLAAWRIDPVHFWQVLVYGEVVGRITGTGPEGGQEGPWMILLGLPIMPGYFIARFAPWSIPALLGALALLGRGEGDGPRWRTAPHGALLWSAVVWTAIVIAAFSLSSGKRADYIAPVYAPAAIVAAWWLLRDPYSPLRTRIWIAPILAFATLAVHIAIDQRGGFVPGDAQREMRSIVDRVLDEKTKHPGVELVVAQPQMPHVAVLCGDPAPFRNSLDGVLEEAGSGRPILAFVGFRRVPPELADLVASGRAVPLWTVDMPPGMAPSDITFPTTMYRIEAEPQSATAPKRP